jgi:hypothetical protein
MQLESFESGSLSFPYISILCELVCFHPFLFISRLGLGMLGSQQQEAIFQAFPVKQINKIVYNSRKKLTRCQVLMLFLHQRRPSTTQFWAPTKFMDHMFTQIFIMKDIFSHDEGP